MNNEISLRLISWHCDIEYNTYIEMRATPPRIPRHSHPQTIWCDKKKECRIYAIAESNYGSTPNKRATIAQGARWETNRWKERRTEDKSCINGWANQVSEWTNEWVWLWACITHVYWLLHVCALVHRRKTYKKMTVLINVVSELWIWAA